MVVVQNVAPQQHSPVEHVMVTSTQTLPAQPATETEVELATTVHGQLDDGQDFTQEFPFKQLGAAEWATMVSATADHVPAPLHELQPHMYVQTNHIPVVPVQPRAQCPNTHERPVDDKPWNLFSVAVAQEWDG
jgi:hypothetical protein